VHGLDAAVARQIDAVRAVNPAAVPTAEDAGRVARQLVSEFGLAKFRGAVLIDAKPRLLLRFTAVRDGIVSDLGSNIVLKVYGDQPRGEGPLLTRWRRRGVPTPRLHFGERDGCSWLAMEDLTLTSLEPYGRADLLALTNEMASLAERMHEPEPQLAALLRPLDAVMLPRWDAAVAALRSAGHDVPTTWRLRTADAYQAGRLRPLHGDLGPTNVSRLPAGGLVVYDASALLGPVAFDGARWAARFADATVTPTELFERWAMAEELDQTDGTVDLLASECVLEAGSLEIIQARGTHRGSLGRTMGRASALRLAFARDLFQA
jgi:hypothetical protein